MSKTIWKFPLAIARDQLLSVPVGAQFLHVAEQGVTLCLWVLVDPNAAAPQRHITVVGTGHPAPEDEDYIGSAVCENGRFVWHVFVERVP